ncbi:MAG: helix-turn-helix domain-containing protein, partial [Flavitalea sp.]
MLVHHSSEIPGLNIEDLKQTGFKVHKLSIPRTGPVTRGRRDYYKMGLVTGEMTWSSGGDPLKLSGTGLFFINPNVKHKVVVRSNSMKGIACLFTEAFISGRERSEILRQSPLFQTSDSPLVNLTKEQAEFMNSIFEKMLTVHKSDYLHKSAMILSCIEIILLEALRIQPSQTEAVFKNSASRITYLFMNALEKQFPVEQANDVVKLRTAQDFAACLSVHVNYLNRSVKEVTGKPTSVIISERIVAEAKALLQFTEWSVADIAYALGFEYTTYFNNYFKRITGTNPN